MRVRLLSFSDQGEALAARLAAALGGAADRGVPAGAWAARYFDAADALVFVGAAGIAVRSVAPHIKSKATDPAVVAVDEGGRFAVPLLSGHLGGANDLARRIGEICGAAPVITTATDVRGAFAVDEWARRQNCALLEPERILPVSARVLRGDTVTVTSDWPIAGDCPPGVAVGEKGDILLSLRAEEGPALHLVPRIGVLGVGCRRGTARDAVETAFREFLAGCGLHGACVAAVCSIDRKAEEPGLLAFCADHGWPFRTFSAEELSRAEGDFSSSGFVAETVGVDNVCERAAVLGSGGRLIARKYAKNGVTMALAVRPYAPSWRWRYE